MNGTTIVFEDLRLLVVSNRQTSVELIDVGGSWFGNLHTV